MNIPPPAQYETKFLLDNSRARTIITWLQHRCRPEPAFPDGTISSIYFDTRDWRFLKEKINGDFLKTKVRIRWYSDIENLYPADESYLEVKYKIGRRREKVRIKTKFPGIWLSRIGLDDRELLNIPHLLRLKGVVIPGRLSPVFQISFKRRRFIEPTTGLSLNVDWDIVALRVNRRILPRTYPIQLKSAVFELKGTGTELPEVLHQLTALGCRKQAFSKYSACYQKIMQIEF